MDDDQQYEDDLAAAYAQQENEERRQWEERILARGRKVWDEFKRENQLGEYRAESK